MRPDFAPQFQSRLPGTARMLNSLLSPRHRVPIIRRARIVTGFALFNNDENNAAWPTHLIVLAQSDGVTARHS